MKLSKAVFAKPCNTLKRFIYQGTQYFCPLCGGSFRRFLTAGVIPRRNAACPGCGSLERHRLLWLTLDHLWRSKKIQKEGRILHVAPEKCLEDCFKKLFDYVSVDLDASQAMMAMDITAIPFPDESFDSIVCNHVLEHIADDRKAIAELYRVLKPRGWASIQVPIKGEVTQEDLSITNPKERERLYGQSDHVRQYGSDFKSRLEEAGFAVLVFQKTDLISPLMLERIGIGCEKDAWICIKEKSKSCSMQWSFFSNDQTD